MQKAPNNLGIVFFPAFDWAISPTHPEREERLLYTMDQLREEGIFDIPGITEYKPKQADLQDVGRVHFCFPDIASKVSESHLIAAGGAIKAGELYGQGKEDKSFALIRPPGHHAMKTVHGGRGFCLINNEAIMLEYLREHYGVQKAAIVDTDCHHGDGTQDIYWHDPDTLYISVHQDGRTLFPGSGFPEELGGPKALGKNLNIPLPPGTSDPGFLHVLDHLIIPVLRDFRPEIIINSAGQDNHFSDPLTGMKLSARGYSELNKRLNPDIAVLEGGYSIQGALPYVNLGIVLAMAGLDFSKVREPDFDPGYLHQSHAIGEQVKRMTEQVGNYYHHPGQAGPAPRPQNGYFHRRREIFYDTEFITEKQREYLLDCGNCRGLLVTETESTQNKRSLGLEIPKGACANCLREGERLLAKSRQTDKYRHVHCINRAER